MMTDFSAESWVRIKGKYVWYCANNKHNTDWNSYHGPEPQGDPLLQKIKGADTDDWKKKLSEILAGWLDSRVLPTLVDYITVNRDSPGCDGWAAGMVLFTFSPAKRSAPPANRDDPDRMTDDLCRSIGELRQCLDDENNKSARGVLGRALGRHFSDVKDRLVVAELKELSLRSWWRIEPVYRRFKRELERDARSDYLPARRQALNLRDNHEAFCKALIDRLPPAVEIARWKTLRNYIDVFDEPRFPDDVDEMTGGVPDENVEDELGRLLMQDLEKAYREQVLSDTEYDALVREYLHGVATRNKDKFKELYGMVPATHDSLVKAGLEKLGRWVRQNIGE